MLKITVLNDLKIYKNQKLMFDPELDKRKFNVIFNFSNKYEDLVNFVCSGNFFGDYVRSLYTPRLINSSLLKGKKKIIKINDYYKQVERDIPKIVYMKPNLKMYDSRNLFYDMFSQISFFISAIKMAERQKAELLFEYFTEIINDKQVEKFYKNKVVIMHLNEKVKDINEYFNNPFSSPVTLFYYMMKKKLLNPDKLSGITFLVFSSPSKSFFKFFPTLDPATYQRFFNLCSTLLKKNNDEEIEGEKVGAGSNQELPVKDTEENIILSKKEEKSDIIKKSILSHINTALGKPDDASFVSTREKTSFTKLEEKIEEKIDDLEETKDDMDEEDVAKQLEDDEDFINYMNEIAEERIRTKRAELSEKQKEKLIEKQSDVIFHKGMKLKDILAEFEAKSIVTEEIPAKVIHQASKISKLKDLDASYNKKQKEADMAAIFSSFSTDEDIPLFIQNIKREDSSDEMNKMETITVNFKDSDGIKHVFKIDYPKLVDDKYMYLNGGKKSITKQIMLLPIVKTKADTIQITSNYGKLFVIRYGAKFDPYVTKFQKFLKEATPLLKRVKVSYGNTSLINAEFNNTLEFDELSSFITRLEIDNHIFSFNRKEIINEIEELFDLENIEDDYDIIENEMVIGFVKNSKRIIIVDKDTNKVYEKGKGNVINEIGNSIIDTVIPLIVETSGSEIENIFESQTTGKRFAYSRVTILSHRIPMILLLGFANGISSVLKQYGVDYEFVPKKKKSDDEDEMENYIRFADGYLYFPAQPLRYSLLLNGLSEVKTSEYNFSDFDKKDVYLEIFQDMFNSRNISKGLLNIISLFLDPITKDILKGMDLPTEFTPLLLHANTLLESTSYRKANDLSNYRIRGNEQINSYLYKIFADSYRTYRKARSEGAKKVKVSVPRDALIKAILNSPNVEEYSVLNPISEAENSGRATYKGLSGQNLEESYGLEIRSYDETMLGVLGLNTPDSSSVGVVRQLTYNPKLLNDRGFLPTNNDKTKLDPTELLTPAELLSPFTSTHADPPRIGMQTTQSKHIIPTKIQNKPLFGSGIEKTLPYILGSDFVFKAKDDGIVELIDENYELMIIKYKDGSKEAIDLSPVQAKNSNGGFWITNKKETDLRVGSKFKKNDIIAANRQYFHGSKDNTTYVTGKFAKVAITGGDFTYEDSAIITEDLSNDMSSQITMKKSVNLGLNANIDYIVKKGQEIRTSDPLIIFESSFDDKAANELLEKIGEEFGEVVSEMGKNTVRSKYTGTIVDIKIFYNRPIKEFSPSIQKLLNSYIKTIETRKKIVKEAVGNDQPESTGIIFAPTTQIKDTKIQGEDVDGILIEFYIRYIDPLKTGDKIAFYTALKSIVSDVIKKGEEPFSELHPEEPIQAILSPMSIVSRMTTDVYSILWLNKVLVELKNKIRNIWK
jgi:hypothetical protein